jgi:hypothetical protein
LASALASKYPLEEILKGRHLLSFNGIEDCEKLVVKEKIAMTKSRFD